MTGWKFSSINQKHYPDMGSDASSVWNFCARFSAVISRGLTSDGWRREMSAVFSKSSRNHLSCVSKRPILSDFVQCRLCICQNWPAGPLPYRISLEMKWLFPKSFRWKTISSVHTIYDLTDLTGEFSLRAKLSLRRLWSGRSVLTNGKHSLPQTLPFALSK